jgi:hypothetical protein
MLSLSSDTACTPSADAPMPSDDSLATVVASKEGEAPLVTVPVPTQPTIDQDTPDPMDMLAAEFTALQQAAKRIAIIGSRNIPLPHQQLIEGLAFNLVKEGNTIVTSGGQSGTNAAAIRGGIKANPELLMIILPQTIEQQPSEVQDQLIGVPKLVEHPERRMMTLADASRLCNREIVDECDQLLIFLFHDSGTLHSAIEYAEERHKIVTAFYLD